MRSLVVLLIICLSLSASAQYKKRSALLYGREGTSRTLSLGASSYIHSRFGTPAIGFHYTAGGERIGSKWFSNTTIRVLLPTDFKLKTIGETFAGTNQKELLLTARTTVMGGIDYDFGRYLSPLENIEGKFIPYILGGIGFHIGKFKEGSDNTNQLLQQNNVDQLVYNINNDLSIGGHFKLGLGAIYFFNEKTGIRFDATYNYVPDFENLQGIIYGDPLRTYGPFKSGVMLQVRFHMKFPENK